MFSEKDLVARSIEDMAQEVEELQALAREEREKSEALSQKEIELRRKSVETRSVNAELAESFWQEAENSAAEVQHRIDIHDQIESLDDYDEVWRQAASARRG